MTGPYQALAARYDRVMEHVDHSAWAAYIEKIWKRHGVDPARILETGAGTCRMGPALAKGRRWYVASDLSPEMLREGEGRLTRRLAADFRRLPFRAATFDAVVCLYDAINYCLKLSDLDSYFREASRVLAPGGVLVADITTSTNSRRHFLDTTSHEVVSGCHIVRHSWYEPDLKLQHNDFQFFEPRPDGAYSLRTEEHVQRIWSVPEFRSRARIAGLDQIGAWDDQLMAANGRRERIHMVFRKGAA